MDNDQVVVRRGNVLLVLEEGEYCCVCKAVDHLHALGFGDPADPLTYTVCDPCFNQSERFHKFLANEFEEALASDPDRWRKNPDGAWTELKPKATA